MEHEDDIITIERGGRTLRLRCVRRIELFADAGLLRCMSRLAVGTFAAGAVLGAVAFAAVPLALGVPSPAERVSLVWALSLVAAVLASLVVHEAVHGALLKLLAPRGAKVAFGADLSSGVLYACAQGVRYPRRSYLCVVLAPAVALTLAFAACGAVSGWWLWSYIVAVVHLSGCAGDVLYALELRRAPEVTWCEDTLEGVAFYVEEDS